MNFIDFAAKHTIIFDGAMGTTIQAMKLPESAWGEYPGNNEYLCISKPDAILEIHNNFYKAGCDVAVTNTFGANGIVLAEYGLENMVAEINKAAVNLADQARQGRNNKYIALSIGPCGKLPGLSQITYDELHDAYFEQISSVITEIDLIIIETCQDLIQIKAAVAAAMDANTEFTTRLPILVSITIEENGNMLMGADMQCVADVLEGYDLFALGLNCSFGPDKMEPALAKLAKSYKGRLYLSANGGMPAIIDGKLSYPMGAEEFATLSAGMAEKYGLSAVGGCCGTTYAHIEALAKQLQREPYTREIPAEGGAGRIASAYNSYPIRQLPAPAIIGERANATGSKAFRDLLQKEDYPGLVNTAKNQTDSSHIIDLSVAFSGRDELADMQTLVPALNRELTLPLMIDSTSDKVIHAALKCISGKPVVNSVNFEDGGEKLHKILGLVKYFPAAVVALTIDEKGMAQTKEEKLAVAERLYNVWTVEYGYAPEDLLIDFLTFSVTSGDEASRYAAVHTIEAIREFKALYPRVNTVLGVSNVSYGLSAASRKVLNTVFLDRAVKAGLDAAIAHAEKLIPIGSINETEFRLCNALLDGEENALANFIEYYEGSTEEVAKESVTLPPKEKLARKIIKGDSTELGELINTLLKEMSATDILNTVLLETMREVGVLFNEGKMLLPFVLKSAEVMRECTKHLEEHLTENTETTKGTVVLATVRGDIHDIGKNLVDIILTGNGYKVINLGIKASGEDIVKAAFEYSADAVGMSGLLLSSLEAMKENIALFSELNLDAKIMLGGAALSEDYVIKECAPLMPGKVYYCKDAFSGVDAMTGKLEPAGGVVEEEKKNVFDNKKWDVQPFDGKIGAEFYGSSGVMSATLADVAPLIRKIPLFEGRWGHRKSGNSEQDSTALQTMEEEMRAMLEQVEPFLDMKFIYGFYPVIIRKNELWISKALPDSEEHNWQYFASFPTGSHMECFTDLFSSTSESSILPLQVVSIGGDISAKASELFNKDKYESYYKYHGLMVELTEALASYAQQKASSKLHITQADGTISDKTWRYSFGYPLCPDLAGNKALCDLLRAQNIGVTVNETFQMEPIYSTCAMLSWHPNSRY